jgi:peptidoglycan/LPS O-acetylase OafA/YrhL
MAQSSVSNKGRLSGLEVIRGLVALSVVVFHLKAIYVPIPSGYVDSLIGTFSGAVPVFFALSAFSLLYGYRSKLFGDQLLTRFYLRRVFRIFPLFYVMLAIYLLLTRFNGGWMSRAEIVNNLFFLFPFFPGRHENLVWAGWSLGVECMFYVVFPVFALMAGSLRFSLVMLVCFAIISFSAQVTVTDLGLDKTYKSMNFPVNLLYFQAGVLTYTLIRYVTERGRLDSLRQLWTSRISGVLFLSVILLTLFRYMGWPPFLTLTLACIVWILCAYCGLPTWLDNRVTRFFGRLSYGVYLVHPLVLYAMMRFGVYEYLRLSIGQPYLVFLTCALVTLPVVVLLASINYALIESPGIALGEKLVRKLMPSNIQALKTA